MPEPLHCREFLRSTRLLPFFRPCRMRNPRWRNRLTLRTSCNSSFDWDTRHSSKTAQADACREARKLSVGPEKEQSLTFLIIYLFSRSSHFGSTVSTCEVDEQGKLVRIPAGVPGKSLTACMRVVVAELGPKGPVFLPAAAELVATAAATVGPAALALGLFGVEEEEVGSLPRLTSLGRLPSSSYKAKQ